MREIFASRRVEVQEAIERELRPLLSAEGVLLRSVLMGNVDLPPQYREGLEALLAEELNAEKMRFTLELKEKQVKQSELEAAADRARREQAAQAAGAEAAGWSPDGAKLLVVREALRDGKPQREFQVLDVAKLTVERKAESAGALGAFRRHGTAAWRSQTLALRRRGERSRGAATASRQGPRRGG